MKFFLTVFIMTFSMFATEFKLADFSRYGSAPGLELRLYPEKANKLDEIFSVIEFTRNELYVRLIGDSSDKTNKELLKYYNEKFPHWKGNLEKEPHLVRLKFISALKSTSLFKELNLKLNENNFIIQNISFEKLHFSKSKISIPDVYIDYIRTSNRDLKWSDFNFLLDNLLTNKKS